MATAALALAGEAGSGAALAEGASVAGATEGATLAEGAGAGAAEGAGKKLAKGLNPSQFQGASAMNNIGLGLTSEVVNGAMAAIGSTGIGIGRDI